MTYTTIQGDMWDSIAYKLYGSSTHMVQLMQANPQYIHVTVFSDSVTLQVPVITEVASSDLPPWKKVTT